MIQAEEDRAAEWRRMMAARCAYRRNLAVVVMAGSEAAAQVQRDGWAPVLLGGHPDGVPAVWDTSVGPPAPYVEQPPLV